MPDKLQYNSNRERKKNSKYQDNNIYSNKHIRNKEFLLDKIKNDKKEIEKT
jgi:hypothetical protein